MAGIGSNVRIRRYRKADRADLEGMFEEFEGFLASIDSLNRLAGKKLLAKRGYGAAYLKKTLKEVSKNKGVFYVAEVSGKLIGLAAGVVRKPSRINSIELRRRELLGEITELYVDTKFRGRGVAAALMRKMEIYLRGRGCTSASLFVAASNSRARRFYEKSGYRDWYLGVMKRF